MCSCLPLSPVRLEECDSSEGLVVAEDCMSLFSLTDDRELLPITIDTSDVDEVP